MTTLDRIREFWRVAYFPINRGPVEIPNVGRNDLAQLFAHLGLDFGVEIGTERGLYAERLLAANPSLCLHCVDPYLAYRGYREHTSQLKLDDFYNEAQERLSLYRASIIRTPSIEAVTAFADESQDFVYIDGNHSLLHVVQDLCYWTPKVRRGGIVAGHDWISRKRSDYLMHVPEAVTAYVSAYDIRPLLILGRKEIVEGEVRDKPRSWLFVKE